MIGFLSPFFPRRESKRGGGIDPWIRPGKSDTDSRLLGDDEKERKWNTGRVSDSGAVISRTQISVEAFGDDCVRSNPYIVRHAFRESIPFVSLSIIAVGHRLATRFACISRLAPSATTVIENCSTSCLCSKVVAPRRKKNIERVSERNTGNGDENGRSSHPCLGDGVAVGLGVGLAFCHQPRQRRTNWR